MSLAVGTRFGPYEILTLIGSGGMGEVYRARDTKLNRDVAIKVLPDALRRDPERLARFEREAQVLATLNHPHIAQIHGFEDSTDVPALVMELVDGSTLADRIGQGPVPVVEALAIATQIADALEAAHEQGIVHRDLKPANIKVRDDGTVKVLDFGLAKALDPAASSTNSMSSPTMMAGTLHGVILGTAAYMSPEQARGKTVDKRTDIWAFGCVLFEMLTGRQAFPGETVSDTIVAILNSEPDWRALPESSPASVRSLLRRCLAKDRAQRLRDIGDAKLALEDAGPQGNVTPVANRVTPSWRVLIAALVAALALGAATRYIGRQETRGPSVVRFQVPLGAGQNFPAGNLEAFALALSPDARRLAFVLNDGIHVRSIDQIDERRIPGTEGGQSPAFSPDGESLIFQVGLTSVLKTVRLSGGAPAVIPGAARGDTPGWDAAGIVFGVNLGMAGVHFLPNGAAAPERVTKPDPAGGGPQRRPQLLPDPDKVLFTVYDETPRAAVASRKSGTWHVLDALGEAWDAHYVRSGYLVFGRGQEIMAMRFDPDSLQAVGAPIVLATGARAFSLSETGSLAYLGASRTALVWVDRHGRELGTVGKPENVSHPRVSPDGRRLAAMIDNDIWAVDLERGGRLKLTTGGGNFDPTWHPNGKLIALRSSSTGEGDISVVPADGSQPAKLLLSRPNQQQPFSWSPDGRFLAFMELNPTTGWDLWMVSESGDARPLLATRANESVPTFSPDGKWIAYVSDESGRRDVYVRPFPAFDRKWAISTEGGAEPIWRGDGKELFYRIGDTVMAVQIETSAGFKPSTPQVLFRGEYQEANTQTGDAHFGAAPDGQRFLMVKPQRTASQIVVVLNWLEELKARASVK